ncbi:hypothetical protein QR680_018299 [Steinernema hermaphroditum]|uniref:Uncharacterized protein n=1 Tax=Steinernema hermaphroditum TaxID=289476 RepID=A0AA39HJM5_9BILA|nr:hypothetical protein QR680_018299 [Steinernema hermaphroditum]
MARLLHFALLLLIVVATASALYAEKRVAINPGNAVLPGHEGAQKNINARGLKGGFGDTIKEDYVYGK